VTVYTSKWLKNAKYLQEWRKIVPQVKMKKQPTQACKDCFKNKYTKIKEYEIYNTNLFPNLFPLS
jgi:hypothetical protein